MLHARINRTNPEKIFIVVKNSYSTSAVTVGYPVHWDTSEADGVAVSIPAANKSVCAAGVIADASIANGSYGLMQIYGYNADAIVDGGTDVAAGDPLVMNAGAFELYKMSTASTTAGVVEVPCGFALAAITAATAAATAVFLKCM